MVLNQAKFLEGVRPGLAARAAELGLPRLELRFGGAGFDNVLDIGNGPSARKIDLAVPSSSLLQWCMGFRSPTASTIEFDASTSGEDLALLDRLFPVGSPFTWGSDRY